MPRQKSSLTRPRDGSRHYRARLRLRLRRGKLCEAKQQLVFRPAISANPEGLQEKERHVRVTPDLLYLVKKLMGRNTSLKVQTVLPF